MGSPIGFHAGINRQARRIALAVNHDILFSSENNDFSRMICRTLPTRLTFWSGKDFFEVVFTFKPDFGNPVIALVAIRAEIDCVAFQSRLFFDIAGMFL